MIKTAVITLLTIVTWVELRAQIETTTDKAFKYYQKGLDLRHFKQYDSSEHYHKLSLTIYEKNKDSVGQGWNLFALGRIAYYRYQRQLAHKYYKKAWLHLEGNLPESDSIWAGLSNARGGILIDLGYRFEARPFLLNALSINTALRGPESLQVAANNYNLGLVDMYFGESNTALDHFMKAYPTYLREHGENGARTAQLYSNIGILHRDIEDYDHAKDYFQRAIDIHLGNHDKDYWNLAYPYFNLAQLYKNKGETKESLDLLLETLRLCEANRKRLIRLESITNSALAEYYRNQGEHNLSITYAHKAIKILKEQYYDTHPRLGEYYKIIGDNMISLSKLSEAEVWYRQAIDVIEGAYGEIHPKIASVYRSQASYLADNGSFDEALNLVQSGLIALSFSFKSEDFNANPKIDSVLDEREYLNLVLEKSRIFRLRASDIEDLKSSLKLIDLGSSVIDRLR